MKNKTALITGITGQDGSYLTELLLSKGYTVHGLIRRSSSINTQRIDHLLGERNLVLHNGDLTDSSGLTRLVSVIKPDEIYNLAAMSHVGVSFETPENCADVDALGTLRLLEAIRHAKLERTTKFYQASTSELYGLVQETPQTEKTPFYPRSPYGVAKLYAYWIVVNYREAYGIYACNGILFNHESPRRGEEFVTRKITKSLAKIASGEIKEFSLGNLNSMRDWGHAKDYVEMQWLMLQQQAPKDYVIATGKQYSIRQFLEWSANAIGVSLVFEGEGDNEIVKAASVSSEFSHVIKEGQVIVRVSKDLYRPTEVETLLGNPLQAKRELGWEPKISTKDLAFEMMKSDLRSLVVDETRSCL